MRIIFTGGGTGGHVFPNIAIVDELRSQGTRHRGQRVVKSHKPVDIFYIGEKGGPEERIAKDENIPFFGIHAGKLRRYFDLRNFLDALKVPVGFFESLKILKKLKPDLVFAKGGYVSVPVVLAARLLHISVWLHESDVTPGLSNKICGRFAEKIWLSFEESKRFFAKLRDNFYRSGLGRSERTVEVSGNPIRKSILKGDKAKGFKLSGFTNKLPVLLVMGGSSGAKSLNEMLYEILPELLKKAQVVHVTGKSGQMIPKLRRVPGQADQAIWHPPELGPTASLIHRLSKTGHADRYSAFEFLDEDLAHIYAITDLAVSRAGSGGIFELLALKKPMILIPLPLSASRGDQIENAEVFEKNGWALQIDQDRTSPNKFLDEILALLEDSAARTRISKAQAKAKLTNAATKIADAMLCHRSS